MRAYASGGIYSVGPAVPHDFQTPYLKYVLGVIGLTDVEVICVEGHAYGIGLTGKRR